MKTQQSQLNVILIFAAALTALFVAGCAEMGSGNTTSLLTAAGFRARTPQTPKQQQIYAALPPYQVQHASVPGKGVFYVYKDEKAGIAYIGREQEYQRYKELAVQQQIAQNYYMAAEMDRAAAFGWYGAWGPRAFWWGTLDAKDVTFDSNSTSSLDEGARKAGSSSASKRAEKPFFQLVRDQIENSYDEWHRTKMN